VTAEAQRHRGHDETTRRLIRELLNETLFVEAGAGTGKTLALVDRYVALVLAGRRVEELVAITFTEKAAAELRDRVRGEMERRLAAGVGEAAPLLAALAGLERAQISTIHAFALNVLRSFAAEHGIDPSFAVQDEVAAERRFRQRWRAFLEDAGSDPAAREVVGRALALGLTTRDIGQLAHDLWGQGAIAEALQLSPLAAPAVPPLDLPGLRRSLLGLDLGHVPETDRLRRAIEGALAVLDELIRAPKDEGDALLAARAPALRSGQLGSARNWGGAQRVNAARAALAEVVDALQSSLAARRSVALAGLLPIVVRFVAEEARARSREGQLMFDDLILRLRNLLRDSAEARRRLRARYCSMLIDEFQDTDPLQVEIALAFARDPVSGWIEPGRLFLVGDPKQSIYRFRRADIAVYTATRRDVEAGGGKLPQLVLNRRSRSSILRFVNQTLAGVIGDGARPEVQPPYQTIHAEREEDLDGPDVAWTGGQLALPARESRRQEAAQVAAYCRAALAQGWQVWDRERGSPRPARFRDIAVLVPARTILAPLERALAAAGVPYRVESGSLIYATQEVRDLINCLAAIDDPTDDIAVVAALRSPAYACSDVEVASYRLDRGTFNYLSPTIDGLPGRVAEALQDLRRRHQSRPGSLAGLIESFVGERRLVEAGMYDAGNRNAFRRARFVIEQARAFEAEGPQSLRAFIEWLERRAGGAILDHEGAGLDDDEDAVRVLTVHAAKGLEFPIVFLAGLGVGRSNQHDVLGLDRGTGAVSVSIGSRTRGANFKLGPVDDVEAQEKAHEAAERDRLLYVAATRARDHLVLFLYHHQKAQSTFAQRLIEAGVLEAAAELPALPPVADAALAPFAGLQVEPPPVADAGFEAARAALVAAAAPAPVTSATALQAAEGEREDESEPWARGRGGTHRGRAVHAALQVLPWDADEGTVMALAHAQAVSEAVPEEAGRIAELLRRALATGVARRARTARRALREVPFAMVQDGVTLEGFVDLVLETDDGLEIVDWKTDAVPAAAVPRRLQGYRLQAGVYVLGLEAATGKRVRRVTYVFVDPAVEVSAGEPAELAAEASARVRELAEA
jgi:ATP-dependent helicase/nuclease subunit A